MAGSHSWGPPAKSPLKVAFISPQSTFAPDGRDVQVADRDQEFGDIVMIPRNPGESTASSSRSSLGVRLPLGAEGATATDLVLTVTQMLRKKGVVGKFVEFYGAGLAALPLADRATIANMAPEYGATCGIFPVDDDTLRYLRLSGRPMMASSTTKRARPPSSDGMGKR